MYRPEYIPARLESWRYASAYPRIPYRKPELEVDLETVLRVNYWPLSPLRGWLAEQLRQDEHQYFGGNNMNENMNLKDLRSGYVVQLRNGRLYMVMRVGRFTRALVRPGTNDWRYLDSEYDENLTCKKANPMNYYKKMTDLDIVKVWGLINESDFYSLALSTVTEHRKLLWSRSEAKKLTVDQISELLGYPVEIVGENR